MIEESEAIAATVAARSGARAFGVCGSGPSLAVAECFAGIGVPFVPVGHEAAGALMAGGVTAAGGFGVSVSIKGPGLVNALPGIVHNRLERLPTLSVAEAYGADIPATRQHKRVDHAGLLVGADVAHLDLGHVDDLPAQLAAASAEPRRPVHLDLAHGVARGDRPDAPRFGMLSTSAVAAVSAARRPVVVVGALARGRPWAAALSELGVPVLTTVAAKGIVDEQSTWAAGITTGSGGPLAPEVGLLAAADFVIAVGLRAEEMLGPLIPVGKPVLHLDAVGLARPDGAPTEIVDPDVGVPAALGAVASGAWEPADVTGPLGRAVDALLADSWSPAQIVSTAFRVVQSAALVCDTGDFCTAAEHVWQAGPDRPFLASARSRFMGSSLPLAIGYALARPRRPVVCLLGDGGIRSYSAELRIAVEEGLRLCVVLARDGRYTSIVRQRPGPDPAVVRTPGHAWAPVVEGIGLPSVVVDDTDGLTSALQAWDDGPLFIEALLPPVVPSGMAYIR